MYNPDKDEQYIKIYYDPDIDIYHKYNIDDILEGFTGKYPKRTPDDFIKKVIEHKYIRGTINQNLIYLMRCYLKTAVNTALNLRKLYALWKKKLIKEDSMFHYLVMNASMQLIEEDYNYNYYARLKLLYNWSLNNNHKLKIKKLINNNVLTRNIKEFYAQPDCNI